MNNTVAGISNQYTCIEDFLQWDRNIYNNMLGKWDFGREMTTEIALNNGDKCNYAFGLEISDYHGLKTIAHQGGTGDFYCDEINVTYPVLVSDNKLYVRFPESTARFCNTKVESELISDHTDYFASPVCSIQFTRMAQNEISGFVIKDVGRARNLVFSKVILQSFYK